MTLSSPANMNLLAAGPWRKTVGLPKRVSFEIGPYLLILSSSHFSAVLALIALRKLRLWPIIGIPSEPGGSFFVDLLLLIKRRNMGIRSMREVNRLLMVCVCV
ncbi:hypothetical protein TorRG33x02_037900 [Trema orientale]|uniref:Transmembrane protein n=1 Tax=Trema orientale TaxID=63057 RepID=A0A2P5FRE6_TREOI|nr:hypothetical protein TorRG33x02_037900 [Trema orientale]